MNDKPRGLLIRVVMRLIASLRGSSRESDVGPGGADTFQQDSSLASDFEDTTGTFGLETVADEEIGPTTAAPRVDDAVQAPPAWLVFKSGPKAGQSIPLASASTLIGRAEDADVVLDDPTVSRRHTNITFEEGTYVAQDAGSSGGTLVQGINAQRTVLMSGASIQIGQTEMVFMQSEVPAPHGTTGMATPRAASVGETIVVAPQPSTTLVWLAVTAGADTGKIFQLQDGDTTIGRGSENHIVIADSGVSRRHAVIKGQQGEFLLLDFGSSGGTKVNGRPLAGKNLRTGGSINVGQTQLVLVDVQPSEDIQSPATEGVTIVAQAVGGGGVVVVQSGPDAGRSFTIGTGNNTIGRDSECEVCLTDPAVSRQHALVMRDADEYLVYDLGSTGGTSVDGEAVAGSALSPGDVISLGRTDLILMKPQQPDR